MNTSWVGFIQDNICLMLALYRMYTSCVGSIQDVYLLVLIYTGCIHFGLDLYGMNTSCVGFIQDEYVLCWL